MDPVANMSEQIEIAAEIMKLSDECDDDGHFNEEQVNEVARLGTRLAELVQAMEGWRQMQRA